MSIQRVSPEKITVSTTETALKVTQTGRGNAFVVEDSTSPDSSAFVIDSEGRVGIKKTPSLDLDIDGIISATNVNPGYTSTATSGGTTVLTVSSTQQQFFTGSSSQTITLPVTSTLTLGHFFTIHNNSTGALTVNSSGGNLVLVVPPRATAQFTCILASGTTAASWDADIAEGSGYDTTETSGGTTVLSVSSAQRQFFTGSSNHTVTLPVVSTLTLGQFYIIHNNSTGTLTINSSGGNLVLALPPAQTATFTAIATTGTDASVWDVDTYKTVGYETTATSAGTKTLSLASAQQQFFTGTTTHTVDLPVTSTLVLGDYWVVHNNSTGNVTVRSSGGNNIVVLPAGTSVQCTCIITSGTTAASWDAEFIGNNGITGTGSFVLSASPTLTGTPAAPTASAGTNTTQIATTAFVRTELTNLVDSAPATLDTLNELAAALGDDPNFATTVTNSIATKVAKAGDTMTGQLTSTVATGTSPFVVASTTLVSNLNADLLDGEEGSYYLNTSATAQTKSGNLTIGGDLTVDTTTFFVDSSANRVGMGLTTPSARLHVTGSNASGGIWVEDASSSSAAPSIRVTGKRSDANGSPSFSGKLVLERDGIGNLPDGNDILGTIIFGGNYNTSSAMVYPASISGVSDTAWVDDTNAGTGLAFFTGITGPTSTDTPNTGFGTRRMTITSSGSVGIGTSTPDCLLHVTASSGDQTFGSRVQTSIFRNSYSRSDTSEFINRLVEVGQIGYTSYVRSSDDNDNDLALTLNPNGGNVGINTGSSSPTYQLEVNGSFAATTKSFDIEHPTKEGQRLQHGSLEGPENGVYVRGRGTVGSPVELPDYWTGLVHEDSITVQVTPIGTPETLYVADISDNTVTIGGSGEGTEFFYLIHAERKDVEKLVVERDA